MPLTTITDSAVDTVRSANAFLQDLATPTLRLGVTGLSRAGKTVFITSLVQALTTGAAQPPIAATALPGFRAYLEPQPDDEVPRFSLEDHLAVLSGTPPAWPDSTRQISQLRVTLEWDPSDWARQVMGIGRRLNVDIVDYPGEWLIDLGLIERTYDTWASGAIEFANDKGTGDEADAWRQFSQSVDPQTTDAEATAIKGAALYTAYLAAARTRRQQVLTHAPGRFLMPGELAGSPLLTFFPLAKPASPSPLYTLLKSRYESYKKKVVQPFFEQHFARLDRQIVLVDALSALNAGGAALHELDEALESVLAAFRPGRNSWLAAILGRRIDRIQFAATKADHLNRKDHDRLGAILRALVHRAAERASGAGADIDVTAIAALRATEDVERSTSSGPLPCIRGIPQTGEVIAGRTFDGDKAAVIFPGDLPADPHDAFDPKMLAPGSLNFARFRPPTLVHDGLTPAAWPHIGLDRVVRHLIGDRLT